MSPVHNSRLWEIEDNGGIVSFLQAGSQPPGLLCGLDGISGCEMLTIGLVLNKHSNFY